MNFVTIELLYIAGILPLVLLIMYSGMNKRKQILTQYYTGSHLKQDASFFNLKTARRIKSFLLALILLLLTIAMAGPRYGYKWQDIKRQGINIILAVDCSKSMLVQDVKPSRLEKAKREIIALLNSVKGDRIGLVSFSGTAVLNCPLTHDYEAVKTFVSHLSPEEQFLGGTNLSKAIETSISGFDSNQNGDNVIILITDGENTTTESISAFESAREKKIRIYCFGIGTLGGGPVMDTQGHFKKDASGEVVIASLNQNALKKITTMTDAHYKASTPDTNALPLLYNAKIVKQTNNTFLIKNRENIYKNRYQWVLGIALLLAMIEMILFSKSNIYVVLMAIGLMLQSGYAHANDIQVEKRIEKGIQAYKNKTYKTALTHFISAQIDYPDSPIIYFNIGNCYYKLGQFNKAANHYKETLKTEDSTLKGNTYFNLGNLFYQKGLYYKALRNYLKASQFIPEDPTLKMNIERTRNSFKKLVINGSPKKPHKSTYHKKGERAPTPSTFKSNETNHSKTNSNKAAQSDQGPDSPSSSQNISPEKLPDTYSPSMLENLSDMPLPIFRQAELTTETVEKDW